MTSFRCKHSQPEGYCIGCDIERDDKRRSDYQRGRADMLREIADEIASWDDWSITTLEVARRMVKFGTETGSSGCVKATHRWTPCARINGDIVYRCELCDVTASSEMVDRFGTGNGAG